MLQYPVIIRRRAQWGWGIHLDQPGLQLGIDDDIVAVAFETVPVTVNNRCYGFQWMHN